jgi:2',3'-cyclic-nucleotide 2'-phosphodiesterase / 3'-nucleotidase
LQVRNPDDLYLRSSSFAKVATAGPVVLRAIPRKLPIARAGNLPLVTAEGSVDASGYAKYAIDLSK